MRKRILFVGILVGLFLVGIGGAAWYREKQLSLLPASPWVPENVPDGHKTSVDGKSDESVLIRSGDTIERIALPSGEIQPVSAWERGDYSGFSGLPETDVNRSQTVTDDRALTSVDRSRVVIFRTIADPVSGESGSASSPSEFTCDLMKQNCLPSSFFSDFQYQGINVPVQDGSASFWWFGWDAEKDRLYGHPTGALGDRGPVSVCQGQAKTCVSAAGIANVSAARVPSGAFSPNLDRFVMIDQYDTPNLETGKKWELFLYGSADLSKPQKTFDISAAIDRDPIIAYDSVGSVAWSPDGRSLVFGTVRHIYRVDLSDGSLSLLYTNPTADEDGTFWDDTALAFSPSGRYVAFVDSGFLADDTVIATADDEEGDTVGVLDIIDLEDNNLVSEVFTGKQDFLLY